MLKLHKSRSAGNALEMSGKKKSPGNNVTDAAVCAGYGTGSPDKDKRWDVSRRILWEFVGVAGSVVCLTG